MTNTNTNTMQIVTGISSTRSYRTTSTLQAKRHTVASVTLNQEGFSDTNEARYWTQKLGIGSSKKYDTSKNAKKYAHSRSLDIPPFHKREAIANQVLFGPLLSSKHPPFAVVCGPRVNLYGTSKTGSSFVRALYQSGNINRSKSSRINSIANDELEPDRSVQTGGNLALGASFRNDGRLLAVGTDAGEARICDVTMRSTLTTFSANSFPIRSIEWFRNGQFILTGGDDGISRIWNLSSTEKTKSLVELVGHGDVIRCTALWQENKKQIATAASISTSRQQEWKELAVTGSYDHTIRVWNVQNIIEPKYDNNSMKADGNDKKKGEESRCLAVLMHGAPVEALCFLKSSEDNDDVPMWLLSAGGKTIKVWNPLSGQCVGTYTTHHRKTITSLLPVLRTNYEDDSTKTRKIMMRILTASLDGVVQIHSWDPKTGSMRHLYSTKLTDSITSVATDNIGDRFAFGTVSGHVLFKMKGPNITDKKNNKVPKAGTYSFFQRGMNADPNNGDYTVTSKTKKQRKLNKHNFALKKFRYAEALDEVISTRNPKNIAGVLEELGKRRGLTHALSNRDEETLGPILRYVSRYIKKSDYTSILVGVAHTLIDIYGDIVGESEEVDGLFRKLKHQIKLECNSQRSLMLLVGQIESSMNGAASSER
mmetsp:Transcript_12022/g.12924  ORF Transcript_12022/g.12924 Transcript_12022/m.12924 type:complete len:651 (-) Transcript_12022:72-2024(-)